MVIKVRNGCKAYGSGEQVLRNLNLSVKPGTIYGLLGASGCGKTTLLSCMVGLRKLDSGDISVLDCIPGTDLSCIPGRGCGYMPQETTSLHPVFTIKETLWFYGKVYGMTAAEIEERGKFLKDFLQLPKLSKVISSLSGGQLRRVSFAVAMIHEPPLLILDEPTVGLDPLLRQSIWEHLVELVTKERKCTVIITTHYTEEAHHCDVIGVMRRGRIICEQNPQTLLAFHNCASLETAVLNVCREDEDNRKNNCEPGTCDGILCNVISHKAQYIDSHPQINHPSLQTATEYIKSEFSCWIHNATIVLALMFKTLLLLRRNQIIIVAQLLIPLSNIILYNSIVGVDPIGLKMGLVSDEWNEARGASNVTEILEYCERYRFKKSCFGLDEMHSICGFFNQFGKDEINWVSQATEEDALAAVQRGNAIGYFELHDNFSQHFQDRLLYRNYADNETLDGSTMSIRLDMSNAMSKVWITHRLLTRFSGYIKETVENCDSDPRIVDLPLRFNPVYGSLEPTSWIQFIQPFLIIYIMYILASVEAGVMALEKRWGIIDRWTVAGVKFGHIVVSSFISNSLVILAQIATVFSVLPYFYGMTNQGSWLLAMAIVYCTCIGALAFGLLLGTLAKNEMEVVIVLVLVNAFNLISTGGIWPLEAIDPSWRIFCQMMAPTLPIDSFRSILFRGWGFSHVKVWRGFAVSFFYTVLALTLAFWLHKRRK